MSEKELTPEEKLDASRLKSLVEASGITQEELSESLGITQGMIGHILNGRRRLQLDMAIGLSNILKVPIHRFSPKKQITLDSAYNENPLLAKDLALLGELDPATRGDIERTVDLLIRGALSKR